MSEDSILQNYPHANPKSDTDTPHLLLSHIRRHKCFPMCCTYGQATQRTEALMGRVLLFVYLFPCDTTAQLSSTSPHG
jgi:hypothetical protein